MPIEKKWMKDNNLHHWSVQLSRLDETTGVYHPVIAKYTREDEEYAYYDVTIPGFSIWSISASPSIKPPDVVFDYLNLQSKSIYENETAKIEFGLSNTTDNLIVQAVTLYVNQTVYGSKFIEIKPNSSEADYFELNANKGNYAIRIDRFIDDLVVMKVIDSTPTSVPTATAIPAALPTAQPTSTPLPAVTPISITVTPLPTVKSVSDPKPTSTAVPKPKPTVEPTVQPDPTRIPAQTPISTIIAEPLIPTPAPPIAIIPTQPVEDPEITVTSVKFSALFPGTSYPSPPLEHLVANIDSEIFVQVGLKSSFETIGNMTIEIIKDIKYSDDVVYHVCESY